MDIEYTIFRAIALEFLLKLPFLFFFIETKIENRSTSTSRVKLISVYVYFKYIDP